MHALPQVTLIDYEFGNVRSVCNALEAVGCSVQVSREPSVLRQSPCLILPGVGAFGDGMANLKRFGLVELLSELVLEQKKPFLGICVGMQLLAKTGYEHGTFEGLGWLDADVVRLAVDETHRLKVPHVGWNDAIPVRQTPLLGDALAETHSFYFVHSYVMRCHDPQNVVATTHYGVDFPAIVSKDNIVAVQFHPEKSQKAGLALLKNFVTHHHCQAGLEV